MEVVRSIEPFTREQSLSLLSSVAVGRVVFTDRAMPAILPVGFIMDDDTVVIRSARGSRLARAANDAVLAFEADDVGSTAGEAWSVVVTGVGRIELDAAERYRLDDLLLSWVPVMSDVFIRIPLTVVTGHHVLGQ